MKFSIRSIRRRRALRSGVVDIGHDLVQQGKWIAWVNQETGQGRRLRLYVAWRPLAIVAATMMLAGYLAAAVALTLWLDRRPYNMVKFQDVVLPWRWADMNELRGEGFAQHGVAELDAGKIRRGIFLIQRSLSLKPDNEPARLALARLYGAARYYDGVRRTLMPQLKFGFSREVLQVVFEQAAQVDDLQLILGTVAEQIAQGNLSSADQRWLEDWQVRTLVSNQQHQEALANIANWDGLSTAEKALQAQTLIAAEQFEEALTVARSIPPALSGLEPVSLRLQAMVHSAQRDERALMTILAELIKDSATRPEPWMFGIQRLAEAGMESEARRWVGDFLVRFGSQPAVVEAMLGRLAALNDPAMLQHAMERSAEWRRPELKQRIYLAVMTIAAADWDRLRDTPFPITEMDANPPVEFLPDWIEAVLAAAEAEDRSGDLEAFLNRVPLQLVFYRAMIEGFAKAERWDLVSLTATSATRRFPHSVNLTQRIERATENIGEVVEDTRAGDLVASGELTYEEEDVPAIRFKLKGMVNLEEWSAIDALVRQIQRARPYWLNQLDADLDLAAARSAAGQGDFNRLRILVPDLMQRDGEQAAWVTDQAERAIADGNESAAIAMLEAVLVEEKFYHRARAMLKVLTAPSEEPKPAEAESL